jgi:PAS domain S-box-containing protein
MTRAELSALEARQTLYGIVRKDIPFERKAREALELGRRYLDADNGHLTRIDRETDHWEAIVSTDPADGQFPSGLELDLTTTYCRRTLAEDAPIALHDAPNQGWADDPAFETHGLHCYHGTTLIVDDEPFGTVCFVSEDPRGRQFSDGETMFAELIARMLERELERERHEAELTRQTNLSLVLNRILRHNLRNDMAVIRGFTQLMADQLDDVADGTTALTKIDRFMELCEKARELDRIISAEFEREPTDVVSLVEGVVESVTREYPTASVTVESDDAITVSVFPSFERAIRELLENAAKHGGDAPTITVSLELVPNGIEIYITDDGPGLASHEANVLDTGTETPLVHGTGLGLWLSYWIITGHDGSIEATETEDGTTLSIAVPRTSTPGSQKQPQTLKRTGDQYQAAFEEAGDGMTIINDEARIVDVNAEAAAIYGTDRKQLLGRSIREFLPDDFDFDAEWGAIQAADTRRDEIPITRADGGVSHIEYTAKSDIVPGLHLLVTRDVTERKERERELAEIRERFRTFVENSNDIISVVDAEGTAQYVSPAVERILGYAPESMVGRNVFEYVHPDDRERISERFGTLVRKTEPTTDTFEYRFEHADGSWVWLESTASNRTATVIDGFVINARDVTERKKREQALEETTARLESIIQVSPEPIMSIDSDGRIRVWNDAAEDVFGFPAESVLGEGIRSIGLFDEEQAIQFEERLERIRAGETIHDYQVQLRTGDGESVHLSLSAAPLRDASGRVIGAITVAKDITDSRSENGSETE